MNRTHFSIQFRSLISGQGNKISFNPRIINRFCTSSSETTKPIVFNDFSKIGLNETIVSSLSSLGFSQPTPVQKSVIPRILNGESMVMAASTGSGKTLAFMLPVIQNMKLQEETGYIRQPKRPRCLVLVPTRELSQQVLQSIKSLSHSVKISSLSANGGESASLQQKSLNTYPVDIIVGSPSRILTLREYGHLHLSHVRHVIIDEVDTMLTQGFGTDIKIILQNVLNRNQHKSKLTPNDSSPSTPTPSTPSSSLTSSTNQSSDSNNSALNNTNTHTSKHHLPTEGAQLIMATATLTKAVRSLLSDVNTVRAHGNNNPTHDQYSTLESRSSSKLTTTGSQKNTSSSLDPLGAFNLSSLDSLSSSAPSSTPSSTTTSTSSTPLSLRIIEVDGVHRSLPHISHDFLSLSGGKDKIEALKELLAIHHSKQWRTMIFCNTIKSAQAVEFALRNESEMDEMSTSTSSSANEGDENKEKRKPRTRKISSSSTSSTSSSTSSSSSSSFKSHSNLLLPPGSTCLSYHGDLPSDTRLDNLSLFRSGSEQYLVCTDIAARGIDIPQVDHIVMFDFPLNSIDYLHRAGRCGRAGRKGHVSSLIVKRDIVLSQAIQGAISRGLPLDSLSSSKKDYLDQGKHANIVGRVTREESVEKQKERERKRESFGLGKLVGYSERRRKGGGGGEGGSRRSDREGEEGRSGQGRGGIGGGKREMNFNPRKQTGREMRYQKIQFKNNNNNNNINNHKFNNTRNSSSSSTTTTSTPGANKRFNHNNKKKKNQKVKYHKLEKGVAKSMMNKRVMTSKGMRLKGGKLERKSTSSSSNSSSSSGGSTSSSIFSKFSKKKTDEKRQKNDEKKKKSDQRRR